MSIRRHERTDHQGEQLRPLLPPHKPPTGRPAVDHRRLRPGLVWLRRTGAPWRALPERSGSWRTVASRLSRWRTAGLWDRRFAAVQHQAEAAGHLDGGLHCVDGTIIRAPQHAAGAPSGDPTAEALGRSQGGFSPKVHLRAEGGGNLIPLVLTSGQQHEATVCEPRRDQGAVKRAGRGRPQRRPRRVAGDKASSSGKIRQSLRRHGIRRTIPRRQHAQRTGPLDRALYRFRARVECLITRLKPSRRLATR